MEHESLQNQIYKEFVYHQKKWENLYPKEDLLKIDLHCHDYNSDVPDEILGRILNVPETWIDSDKLVEVLIKNEVSAITITNHNNAKSCYEIQERGLDVLTGAEFSCTVPDYNVGIHVLAYGFSKEQEKVLLKLRRNIYTFLEYAKNNDIPTIWAHPLYYYSSNIPEFDFFEKMSIIFERFEVLNGQRDSWQNILTFEWLSELNPERINKLADKYNIEISKYCRDPYKKSISGGSDSHIGLFAGETGTYLYIPNLQERLKKSTPSQLALEAIRAGDMVPYGHIISSERLTISLLDYVCQIALNMKDPGLMRILLHKGTTNDKMLSLIIANAFLELKHHKVTLKFVELFHNSLMGKKPKNYKRLFISKNYKPVFDDVVSIAKISKSDNNIDNINNYQEHINSMYLGLVKLLFSRLEKKINKIIDNNAYKDLDINTLIEKIEIPIELRSLLVNNNKKKNEKQSSIIKFLDGLSFPFLTSSLILAAHYTSAKVLFNNRALLNAFSEKVNKFKHPKRMLWLTDTYDDKNGVALFMQSLHKEIKRRNLPIDILVCSNTVESDDNLIVLKPLIEITIPMNENQKICFPDFLALHQVFHNNEYDRIMCSTEGIMGIASLYLKNAFSVKANFFIHTDWITYGKKVLKIERSNLNRFRRILRAFYRSYDNLFVLNSEQQKWLSGREMSIDAEKIHITAHWTEAFFKPVEPKKNELFGVNSDCPIMLFVGRISLEKGIMELVEIYKEAKTINPNIRLVLAGTGPELDNLKLALPEAIYLGWVNREDLPAIYSSSDLLVLPSQFDTFSFVVLEALACGLPVISYKTKGPKDIIYDGKNGFLASNLIEFIEKVKEYFGNNEIHENFRLNALKRASDYTADEIINKLLHNVELL